MNTYPKFFIILSIVIFIFVLMFVLFVNIFNSKQGEINITTPVVSENYGIKVFSPKQNEIISSPIKITGVVNGNGWTGFEGQVGTVHLLDGNGKELAVTYLPATTEWTQLPTNFETNLAFSAVSGTSGTLVFKNENASGDLIRDKTFTLPIRFK